MMSIYSQLLLKSHPGDERQLALVFQNLLSNPMKYAKAGAAPRIDISAEERAEDRVFKRLHEDAYPGTGLGMAICRRIVERYGGAIEAASEGEGLGSVFSFSLRKAAA